MIANTEIYSASSAWRREKWTYRGIPLMPFQVNLDNFYLKTNTVLHINFPEKPQLSALYLCRARRTVVITTTQNMKDWINLVKNASNFDIDPLKTKIFINHNLFPTHYKYPNKLELFDGLSVFISTQVGFSTMPDRDRIIKKDYITMCDVDVPNTVVNKHCDYLNSTNKDNKVIMHLVPRFNATYTYKRIIEYYTPNVNITRVEPDYDILDAIKLFKNKQPIYIVTNESLDIKEYKVQELGYNQSEFYDDEPNNHRLLYIDRHSDFREYLPCNNVLILDYEFWSGTSIKLARQKSPLERDIEIIIIPNISSYVYGILRKADVKHERYLSNIVLTYKLCKAFGCDIKTLNKVELTMLFSKEIPKLEEWENQPDNKFTRAQVGILLKVLR
jgi:hypothetical protein